MPPPPLYTKQPCGQLARLLVEPTSASLFQNGAPPPDVPRSATHCASVASSSPLDAHVAPVLRKLVRYCGVHAMALRARAFLVLY